MADIDSTYFGTFTPTYPIPPMHRQVRDLTGKRFGRWSVLNYAGHDGKQRYWFVECDCGVRRITAGGLLTRGKSKSCGCSRDAVIHKTALDCISTIDMTGWVIGKWTVLRFSHRAKRKLFWWCKCACGVEKAINGTSLRHGGTKSCGCNRRIGKHHLSGTPTYGSYQSMIHRCYTSTDPVHQTVYQQRQISVCVRWRFGNLIQSGLHCFIEDMGMRPPNTTLDRINGDGHYSCGHCEECLERNWPANCRWGTVEEQNTNRRTVVLWTFQGETLSIAQWARRLGIRKDLLYSRRSRNWPVEKALTTPSQYWLNQYAHR